MYNMQIEQMLDGKLIIISTNHLIYYHSSLPNQFLIKQEEN